MNLETVKDIVRNLSNKTVDRGCTEAEAFAAAEKVGQLLQTYNLNMTDVILNDAKCVEIKVNAVGNSAKCPMFYLVCNIAWLCDCHVWNTFSYGYNDKQKYVKTMKYHFFGLEHDVKYCEYLYHLLSRAQKQVVESGKLTHEYIISKHKKRFTTSVVNGFATRLNGKMKEIRQANNVKVKTAASSSALMVLKTGKVEDDLKRLGINVAYNNTQRVIKNDSNGYCYGFAKADDVNLGRPLGQQTGGYLC
jgi:hypothetical protein